MMIAVSIRPISARAVQIAVGFEVAWALFLAYEVHHRSSGGFGTGGWQLELLNFIASWANAAIAIVVVTWLADAAVAQFKGR
jgi:hypothetical protein